MKITVSGFPGAGKSTLCRALSIKLGLVHYSTGDYMRRIAKERGISVIELSTIAVNDPLIDRALDAWQKSLASEDDFIIDARIGWYFIPQSIKIYLGINLDEAARRIFQDKRHGERYNVSLLETKKMIHERIRLEKSRYMKYYNIDYTDERHYDIVLDTTNNTSEQTVDILLSEIIRRL